MNTWARLPAGPFERHCVVGIQGGIIGEEVRAEPSRRNGYHSWEGGVSGKPLLVIV